MKLLILLAFFLMKGRSSVIAVDEVAPPPKLQEAPEVGPVE